jgi:transcriptional regulator GlxA family with amidase domain
VTRRAATSIHPQRRVEREGAAAQSSVEHLGDRLGCGYAEQSSFTRAFQKVTGAAPAFYRNSVAR